jgi:hypothetical protein
METFTATCHTDGCPNADIPIELAFDPTGPPLSSVVCGVCGQVITDTTLPPGVLLSEGD